MVLTDALSALLLLLLWSQNKSRFKGLDLWMVDFSFQTVAMGLLILRGFIPDFYSIVVANFLIASGTLAGVIGYARFLGIPRRIAPRLAVLCLFTIIHYWFGVVRPNLPMRNLNIGSYLLLLDLEVLLMIFRRATKEHRKALSVPLAIHLSFAALGIARVIEFFLGGSERVGNDFFQGRFVESAGLVAYQVLLIALTYGLAMAVNRRLATELSAEHDKFSKAFHGAPYAMFLAWLDDGTIAEVNSDFEEMTGYRQNEVTGKSFGALPLWSESNPRVDILTDLVKKGKTARKEIKLHRKDGSSAYVLLSAETITLERRTAVLAAFADISDRKMMEDRIRELSRRDPLTGVFNRRHFFELLGQAIEDSRIEDRKFAIALLDMDDFKQVNDTYGHQAGDETLMRLVGSIGARIGPADTLARYGGEEFVILFADSTKHRAVMVMQRVLQDLAEKNLGTEDEPFSCTFSCGVTSSGEWEAGELSSDALLARVDGRLYKAKRAGKNRIVAD